jgi:hypothetical protein
LQFKANSIELRLPHSAANQWLPLIAASNPGAAGEPAFKIRGSREEKKKLKV